MSDSKQPLPPDAPVDVSAAEWFFRRDRGLREPEQAAYVQWLREDPRHAAAMARAEKVWTALDPVFARHAIHGFDPDRLSPSRIWRRRVWIPILAAAAAAVVLLVPVRETVTPPPSRSQVIVHPGPERLNLPDGSVVELNASAKVAVQFTPSERRVRIVRGEVFFAVAKNPARPFVVSADRINVRAIGTAFSVRLDQKEISVLVTEGRVGVNAALMSNRGESPAAKEFAALVAGQRGVVQLAAPGSEAPPPEMIVTELSETQVERALAWQGLRLEFFDRPLGDIVNDFNRYNRKKMVVHDAATAAIRVGGSFRTDNVNDFVRFLGVGFGVSGFPHGDEIVLRKTSPH